MIGYSATVRSAMILLVGPMSALACASGPERPAQDAPPVASLAPPAPPRARVTACRAEPSTVYGEEPVIFRLEGEAGPNTLVGVEVWDLRQRVAKDSVAVPGQWSVPALPSGDFTLKVDASEVSCQVTVNRELPRASPAAR